MPMQEFKLDFGTFQFFSDYMTSVINEGVNLDIDKLSQLYSLCHDVYEGRDFSIIELRNASFSIDPLFYMHSKDLLKNVKSHAMVVAPNSRTSLSQYESNFIKHCPFHIFHTLSDAISWTQKQLETNT